MGRSVPSRVAAAIKTCDAPYGCDWSPSPVDLPRKFDSQALLVMYERLVSLGNKNFLTSMLYARLKRPMFDTTSQAMAAIAQIDDERKNREHRCFQRCLLAIKTSRSFEDQGVLFIGAMLETLEMHAWIIEAGTQPDHEDRSWINHRPLVAYAFKIGQ